MVAISNKEDQIVSIKKVNAVTQFDNLTPIIKDQAMQKNIIQDYALSDDSIKTIASSEVLVSGLKDVKKRMSHQLMRAKYKISMCLSLFTPQSSQGLQAVMWQKV